MNHRILIATLPSLLTALSAFASEGTPAVGDAVNGAKLYAKECASCHGDGGTGGRSGVSLTDSGRMNLLRDDQLFAMIERGANIKKEKDHSFKGKVSFLDLWDMVAYMGTLYQPIGQYFGDATHYVAKEYAIDEHGLKRIADALGKQATNKKAAVFTFFKKGEADQNLEYVPQDPIKLDHLKKKEKTGYVVFLPLASSGYTGEVGLGMDAQGKLTRLAVHPGTKGSDLMNKSLSRFTGMGKKGQKETFKIGGGKELASLAGDIFPLYLEAMELATMYDRDENERTWADSD